MKRPAELTAGLFVNSVFHRGNLRFPLMTVANSSLNNTYAPCNPLLFGSIFYAIFSIKEEGGVMSPFFFATISP
jgi:hypothetical protein